MWIINRPNTFLCHKQSDNPDPEELRFTGIRLQAANRIRALQLPSDKVYFNNLTFSQREHSDGTVTVSEYCKWLYLNYIKPTVVKLIGNDMAMGIHEETLRTFGYNNTSRHKKGERLDEISSVYKDRYAEILSQSSNSDLPRYLRRRV